MSRYLGEGFEVYDTVKQTGKVFQVGSQGCSDMKWHKAAEWIQAGKIGQVVMSQGSYMRNTPAGEWNQYKIQAWCTDQDVNWMMWMGQQIKDKKEFSADDYFRWRKYYPYCAGLLSDLFPHKLHPYMLATGNPQFPVRVACIGTRKVETDRLTPDTRLRDSPEIAQLIAEFPTGMVMHITSSTVNEVGTQEMIRGQKATLTMAGNLVQLKPERPFTEEIDPETSEAFAAESIPAHHKNWFDCIRSGKDPQREYRPRHQGADGYIAGRNVRPPQDGVPLRREHAQDHQWRWQGDPRNHLRDARTVLADCCFIETGFRERRLAKPRLLSPGAQFALHRLPEPRPAVSEQSCMERLLPPAKRWPHASKWSCMAERSVALRAAAEEAFSEIRRIHAQLSLYLPSSEVSYINAHASQRPVQVEPGLFALLQLAQRIHQETRRERSTSPSRH